MTQIAYHDSAEQTGISCDFTANHSYLKKLMQHLKAENGDFVRKHIFGEGHEGRRLTKKEMKQLFRVLRKIENRYDECQTPPIPEELEHSIRSRSSEEWLPWELEAIEKIDTWREQLPQKNSDARRLLEQTLENFRAGRKLT
jgi:Fe-S cluster biosynthesis and repair protein YggX